MPTVQAWTGRETRALRQALRMSIRDFAENLGVSERTVSKWEAGRDAVQPRPEMQAALDTVLSRAGDGAGDRFVAATSRTDLVDSRFGARYQVQSHKFIPAYTGASAAAKLAAQDAFHPRPHEWLEVSIAGVPHAEGTCTAHLFACGVVVLHLSQELHFSTLASLAAWRYASYEQDLPWAADQVARLLSPTRSTDHAAPEYVLSMYVLQEPAWSGAELETALRLMSLPSVLVNRRAHPFPEPVGDDVERRLLAQGFDQPSIQPFGVHGLSVGYASWAGMAYHALSPEQALVIDDLVSCEVDVQMLWAYCRHIQRQVEDGQDPAMPREFGWRFLRAAHSRLTTARARETSQHCMMREAALSTSGLPERLTQAQTALRETAALSGRVNT
ncbi:helix-turn-helix domain-containing protein [Micromonospora saelicesensis]|uniref:Helix-turn-helix domain-containing protein n=1 Tax=Micromonospora saelicesensis TaxID=285676 RepID=A0A1C4U2F0_9ACTN|nr:helix-turn-helix domain-containing protein [Micromonospora saelicesensis]SCE65787.1 Helix-turn-helix domain-containing protein [Micromonospora saelicesensis]